MIYVRENTPNKLLTKHILQSDIECIFLELNFRKCKWLLLGTYHRPSQNDHYFFENLDSSIVGEVNKTVFFFFTNIFRA